MPHIPRLDVLDALWLGGRDMSRLYLALGAFAIVGSLAAALWWQIDRNAALRAKLESCNSTISKSEDFNDAASNPDGKSWLERLLPSASN